MNRINHRKTYRIVLDTETAGFFSFPIVYDIGWAIVGVNGEIYEKRSYAVSEVFFGQREKMKTAYYADKIPQYFDSFGENARKVASFFEIRVQLMRDIEDYHITAICAHNARFDVKALNNTLEFLTDFAYCDFFPESVEIWDSLKIAKQVLGTNKNYLKFCLVNEYMTKHKIPQPRMTAEILYRYISGEEDFVEKHTGIDDVMIEAQILVWCLKKGRKLDKVLIIKH